MQQSGSRYLTYFSSNKLESVDAELYRGNDSRRCIGAHALLVSAPLRRFYRYRRTGLTKCREMSALSEQIYRILISLLFSEYGGCKDGQFYAALSLSRSLWKNGGSRRLLLRVPWHHLAPFSMYGVIKMTSHADIKVWLRRSLKTCRRCARKWR